MRSLILVVLTISVVAADEPSRAIRRRVLEALSVGEPSRVESAVQELIGLDGKAAARDALALLRAEVLGFAAPAPRLAIIDACERALGMMLDARARKLILKTVMDDGEEDRRLILVDVLALWGDLEAIDALHRLFGSDDAPERVRIQAVRAMMHIPDTSAIRMLRAWHDTTRQRDALYDEVRRFLIAFREPVGSPSRSPADERTADRAWVIRCPLYAGTVFMLDISGSMHRRDPFPGDDAAARGLCPECGQEHRGVDLPADRERMFRARRALEHAISGPDLLPALNLIAFNAEVQVFRQTLVKAKLPAREQALAWLRELTNNGVTRTDLALEEAFALHSQSTVHFTLISDGAPTGADGIPLDAEGQAELLARVRALNRLRKLRIDTYGLLGCDTEFMRALAEQNFGTFFPDRE